MKIMTAFAHPADTITNCGGALALHADAGDEIEALILTHGGRIHPNKYAEEMRKPNPDPRIAAAGLQDIIDNKKDELRRAADIIGVAEVICLDHDDTMVTVSDEIVDQVAEVLARRRPDVIICDYPLNAVVPYGSHTIATMTVLAALQRVGTFLANVDGKAEFDVKQTFYTGFPGLANDALTAYGARNDMFIDITSVVDRKLGAMDCFVSQGYDGAFARKLVESNNGEFGRRAGVAFAEAYTRHRSETHTLLPVTEAVKKQDILTRHVAYSQYNLREAFPVSSREQS